MQKQSMIRLLGANHINEQLLFHGTGSVDALNAILRQGFRAEMSKTAYHGKGTYFAKDASYSLKYTASDKNNNYSTKRSGGGYHSGLRYAPHLTGPRIMLCCKVLTGKSISGSRQYELSSWPKKKDGSGLIVDSLVDNISAPSIYVIHENARCYPMYIVTA